MDHVTTMKQPQTILQLVINLLFLGSIPRRCGSACMNSTRITHTPFPVPIPTWTWTGTKGDNSCACSSRSMAMMDHAPLSAQALKLLIQHFSQREEMVNRFKQVRGAAVRFLCLSSHYFIPRPQSSNFSPHVGFHSEISSRDKRH